MGHLLKIKCVESRVNVHILASTSVLFTLTTVQVPNIALIHTKWITVWAPIIPLAPFQIILCRKFAINSQLKVYATGVNDTGKNMGKMFKQKVFSHFC